MIRQKINPLDHAFVQAIEILTRRAATAKNTTKT